MPFINSVFISATLNDLKEERSAAIETFTELGILTFSMEMFSANYHDKQEVIRKLIGEVDFVALIIGGKYGDYLYPDEKLSFTEWEYNVARRYEKKILAFIPADFNDIPAGKTDQDIEKRERLKEFIKKVEETPLVVKYKHDDIDDLKRAILNSFHMYGYRDKTPSRYCGVWVSSIPKCSSENQFFEAKSDEWTFYGRDSHVYGNIKRLKPKKNARIWSFVGMEFGDQLLISFAENDQTRMSAGVVIVKKDQGYDEQMSGYYYEFAKMGSDGMPIPVPIMLKRKSLDWHR